MVFENREANAIMSPYSNAPYFRSLASSSVTLSRLFAIYHPSLPNYIALTSGSTHDIHSDCSTCLVDGTERRGSIRASGALLEGVHGVDARTVLAGVLVGTYAMKHDPFMYYTDIRNDADRCQTSSR